MTFDPIIVPQAGPTSLTAALYRATERDPLHPAWVFQGQTIGYRDWTLLIRKCRRQFSAWGVGPGDRVAVLALAHPLQVAALLALSELGAIWVPLNFRLASAEWRQIMSDCGAGILLADTEHTPAATELAHACGVTLRTLDDLTTEPLDLAKVLEPALAVPAPDPDRPVLLVYTSGTTGRPKGAVHTVANLLANAHAAATAQGLGPHDRVLTLLPLFHVGGLCIQTLPALLTGATVVLHPRFDPQAALRDIDAFDITTTVMVPAVMKAVIQHPLFATTRMSHLRALWAGSSVLPDDLVRVWLARGVPVCNVYGATETGPFSIALSVPYAQSHVGSCGWPVPGVEARLQPISGAPNADGVGEVCLRGPAIVSRYWPDTPALDEQGWFHSGDLGRIEADGSWRIVGRAKDMIISGGENIYPAEIENILAQHPDVAECAAIGLPDPRWGEQVVAVVVLKTGSQVSDDDLLAGVRRSLARYKHPRKLVRLDQLPKTALGKVQKDRLVQQLNVPAHTAAAPSADSTGSL
jgi:fatty-acyl-CoA synthase